MLSVLTMEESLPLKIHQGLLMAQDKIQNAQHSLLDPVWPGPGPTQQTHLRLPPTLVFAAFPLLLSAPWAHCDNSHGKATTRATASPRAVSPHPSAHLLPGQLLVLLDLSCKLRSLPGRLFRPPIQVGRAPLRRLFRFHPSMWQLPQLNYITYAVIISYLSPQLAPQSATWVPRGQGSHLSWALLYPSAHPVRLPWH